MDNNEVHILPPVRGSCPVCGARHERDAPHDVNSLYYRTKFRQKHGRYPTKEDAEKHCKQDGQPSLTGKRLDSPE